MSQLCKISGGKRIDFSKSGGFNRRANIAVLAFQSPAQKFHEKAYKIIAKKSPSTPLTKFLSNQKKRYLKQIQRKKLFPNPKKLKLRQNATDSNYGENVERPVVPLQIYDNLMENHPSKLKVQNNYNIEAETRGQATSERWRYERSLTLIYFQRNCLQENIYSVFEACDVHCTWYRLMQCSDEIWISK
ncbi:yqaJ domain-containing protein [Trichonephila inaurata madagascariensis]|uniref:YqaJ domain-containing protein n=1 Tax=Trichonephila inaurata madagascariensis TaxID=2747483 RepID=A0A8X6YNZ1_9ARAC|nr:yqaJ domain-containing protein [Trichonephila inaurata madagascariensis]